MPGLLTWLGGLVVISGVMLITIGENNKQSQSEESSSIELVTLSIPTSSVSNNYSQIATQGDDDDNIDLGNHIANIINSNDHNNDNNNNELNTLM